MAKLITESNLNPLLTEGSSLEECLRQLREAKLSPTLSIKTSDGKQIRYRSILEIDKQINYVLRLLKKDRATVYEVDYQNPVYNTKASGVDYDLDVC